MTCTFFGHRDLPAEILPLIKETLIDLIENKDVDLFYVGCNGNFDLSVQAVLSELSSVYPIKYYIVLSCLPQNEARYSARTIMPEGIEKVPPRFAISFRNKWMIEQSDYAVVFVTHSWGGAAKFKEIAEKKGKTVINLAAR